MNELAMEYASAGFLLRWKPDDDLIAATISNPGGIVRAGDETCYTVRVKGTPDALREFLAGWLASQAQAARDEVRA